MYVLTVEVDCGDLWLPDAVVDPQLVLTLAHRITERQLKTFETFFAEKI
jgi:hypothetical protein